MINLFIICRLFSYSNVSHVVWVSKFIYYRYKNNKAKTLLLFALNRISHKLNLFDSSIILWPGVELFVTSSRKATNQQVTNAPATASVAVRVHPTGIWQISEGKYVWLRCGCRSTSIRRCFLGDKAINATVQRLHSSYFCTAAVQPVAAGKPKSYIHLFTVRWLWAKDGKSWREGGIYIWHCSPHPSVRAATWILHPHTYPPSSRNDNSPHPLLLLIW